VADLSPAQKIVAAFNERHELCGPFDDDWVEQCLAAALRAAADQVVPTEKDRKEQSDITGQVFFNGMQYAVMEIRALAAELEAQ
jgi:hypothetical protein